MLQNGVDDAASFALPKKFDIAGLKLPALKVVQIYEREVTLQRHLGGDFGFRIRRHYAEKNSDSMRVFADPTVIMPGPPRPSDMLTHVLPGDELIEVNHVKVAAMSREELQDAIEKSGSEISLTVRTAPELVQLCGRARRGIRDAGDALRLNANEISSNDFAAIPEDSRYWLIHSEGYTVCQALEHLPNNKIKIRVANTEMAVDRSDIDRANPVTSSNEIAKLTYVNVTSVIHLLRRLAGSGLTYSHAGALSMVALTPAEDEYANDTLIDLFKGCRQDQMPSHVYSAAQEIYRNLQSGVQSQGIVLTGVSGSGKSSQIRSFLQYFSGVAGWTKILPFSKLSLIEDVLTLFINAPTYLNLSATQCIRAITMGFDTSAALSSVKHRIYLPNITPLLSNADSYFHIFHVLYLTSDAEAKKKLGLDLLASQFDPYVSPDKISFLKLNTVQSIVSAFNTLQIDSKVLSGVFSVLAAILHLKRADVVMRSYGRPEHAQKAAELLGTTVDELSTAMFNAHLMHNAPNVVNRSIMANRNEGRKEALESFVRILYQELITAVIIHVNQSLDKYSSNTITLFDIPGSNFGIQYVDDAQARQSQLPELIFNYCNERIAEVFYDRSFKEPLEVYAREQVSVDVQPPILQPHMLTRLIDRKPQLLNSVNLEERSEETRGLFHLLQEEAMFPAGSDSSFLKRLMLFFENNKLIRGYDLEQQCFVLGHGLNRFPTTYSVRGWVREARPRQAQFSAPELLKKSKNPAITALFGSSIVNTTDNVYKLRHFTQSIQQESLGPVLVGGFFNNIESQIEHVVSLIHRCGRVFFVHCIQPKANELSSGPKRSMISSTAGRDSDGFDVAYVRAQVQSLLLVDSVRACNRGYPERMPFRDFRRRFQCLIPNNDSPRSIQDALDDRGAVKRILEAMEIEDHRYRLGISQILVRSDMLVELESRRDLQLSGVIEAFQNECRRHLARKWLSKRRTQELAIQCIQQNALKYLQIRQWNWWKLYTRVKPLLSAVKPDAQFHERITQLDSANRNLRSENAQLKDKLAELEQLVRTSTQGSQAMSISLERESELRSRLELELMSTKQVLRDQGLEGDQRRSSTPSTSSKPPSTIEDWQSHAKTIELKTELEKMRDSELAEKFKAQKAIEQLQDLQTEITDLRSKNESYQRNSFSVNDVVSKKEAVIHDLENNNHQLQKTICDLRIGESSKDVEVRRLNAEVSELKVSLEKTKRYLKEAEESRVNDSAFDNEFDQLRRDKRTLEDSVKKLEEEIEETAAHNQQLIQNVTRLEMEALKLRNEKKRDVETRESEISDMRLSHQRQYRALEEEIESLTKNNHDLMMKNRQLESQARQYQSHQSLFDLSSNKYKRKYKKALILLQDAQSAIATEQRGVHSQNHLRQLKNELEDAEAAKVNAVKERNCFETEVNELKCQLEILASAKKIVDDKNINLVKEKNNLKLLLDEHDEQFRELTKKYKQHLQQSKVDAIKLDAQAETIDQLENTIRNLNEELLTLGAEHKKKLASYERETNKAMLESRELQGRLDIETATRQRLEATVEKLNDEIETLQESLTEAQQVRDKESNMAYKAKQELLEVDSQLKDHRRKLEEVRLALDRERSKSEQIEQEYRKALNDYKNANRRIFDLQSALQSEISLADDESESDDEAMGGDSMIDEDDHSSSLDLMPDRPETSTPLRT